MSHADEIEVYLAQAGPMNRVSLEIIVKEPGFSAIRAVAQGNIHIVDESIVSRPTTRLLLGVNEIGTILYHERFGHRGPEIIKQTGLFQNK